MKKQFIIFIMVVAGAGVYAQHDHSAHASHSQEKTKPALSDSKVGAAYEQYVQLKDALVASNAGEAKKVAIDLQRSLATLSNGKKAAEDAGKIASSDDLTAQRKSMSTLSNEMKIILKTIKLTSGSIFVAYCPMANDGEGAFWLSNEKEIRNPYFGDSMLTCGSVKETLQ